MIPALMLGLALAAPAPERPPLAEGRYAMEVVVASASQVPVFGETRVFTRSLLLAELRWEGDVLVQSQHLCAVDVSDDSRLASTVIPPAFVAAFPEQSFPVAYARREGGWHLVLDPGEVLVGYDATAGGMPQEPDDPAVLDWDHDGAPGATVQLEIPVLGRVDIHIAQRGRSVFVGRVEDGGVRGHVQVVTLEQRTLSASHPLFRANPPIRALPELSTFTLRPLPDASGCEAVRGALASRVSAR